jgi:pyruvate formate lyase activating enzyme
LLGAEIDVEEVSRSMAVVAKFSEYRFETTVAPVPRSGGAPGSIRYLSPEEVAEAARWLKEATGSHRQPYVLRVFDPQAGADERFRALEMLPPNSLFRHRSAARKYQVLTEIQTISR